MIDFVDVEHICKSVGIQLLSDETKWYAYSRIIVSCPFNPIPKLDKYFKDYTLKVVYKKDLRWTIKFFDTL